MVMYRININVTLKQNVGRTTIMIMNTRSASRIPSQSPSLSDVDLKRSDDILDNDSLYIEQGVMDVMISSSKFLVRVDR